MQNKIKIWLSKKSNLFTLFVLAFVIWRQAPILLSNSHNKGKVLETKSYQILNADKTSLTTEFPPKEGKAIAIFWATWCGPCKIEMERLQKSVQEGNIDKNKIFAINPFENAEVSKKFLVENRYPFTFVEAPDVSKLLNVEVTPTTIFVENGSVSSASSGMSLIGIWRAEFFLR